MIYTYYGNKPPSFPLFKPVAPGKSKSGFREWGKRSPTPITLTLKSAPSIPQPEIPVAPWERPQAEDSSLVNLQTIRVMEDWKRNK